MVATKPSASGRATARSRSTASTPVASRAVSSIPERTAFSHSSSTMAAVRVASTCCATASVIFWPCSRASRRAWVVTAAVTWRRWRVSWRSSSPDIDACASRSAAPTWSTWSTCSVSCRTSRFTTQPATDGFFSPFTAAARSVPLSSLALASRAGVNSGSVSA